MFAKFVALILAFGIVGGALLTMRQLRIQAAHELGAVQRRVGERDRELWQLRIEIARTVSPAAVRARLEARGGESVTAIGANPLAELWPIDSANSAIPPGVRSPADPAARRPGLQRIAGVSGR